MSEWISVETAPRDGTEFQGWLVTEGGDGFWEPRCRFNEDGQLGIWGRIDYDIDGWDYGLIHLTLTNWQPLPPPPDEG